MALVGLIYVGAVLFINGLLLLGFVEAKAAGVFNLFVGALQVITPTYLIFTAAEQTEVLAASGIYLFGFTYLYVGITLLAGLDSTGVGYFSLFVSIMAIGYAWANWFILADRPYGIIWLYWSFLWALFWINLGLKRERITRYTGWVSAIQGWVTAAIPSFLILADQWREPTVTAVVLAAFGVVVFTILAPLTIRRTPRVPEARTSSEPAIV